MPFPYYRRLSAAEQALYRKSAAVVLVPIPDAAGLRPLLPPVEAALRADQCAETQGTVALLVDALLDQLGAPPLTTRVLAKRPKDEEGGELHGLYELDEDGTALVRVWMRTAEKQQPVAFKTFLRTVLHEVVHHLDFTILDLAPSFHTEGFFAREAHLTRQLLGDSRPRALAPPLERHARVVRPADPAPAPMATQLKLW